MDITQIITSFDIPSLAAGIAIPITAILAYKGIKRIFGKKNETFAGIKEKLLKAYEGNKTSATVINELYEMFAEVEKEAMK